MLSNACPKVCPRMDAPENVSRCYNGVFECLKHLSQHSPPSFTTPGCAASAALSAAKRGRKKRGSSDSEDEGRALAPAFPAAAEVMGWPSRCSNP